MISKAKIKFIKSLEHKKYRLKEQAFLVEGAKAVEELLPTMRPRLLVHTPQWVLPMGCCAPEEVVGVTEEEMQRVSMLQHPQTVLAVFPLLPSTYSAAPVAATNNLTVVLDGVQDPGNLGTIVRTADWLGVRQIVCSPDTVDIYNPKVVQATMGSLARVQVCYTALPQWLDSLPNGLPVFGTFLDGQNLYDLPVVAQQAGVIVMGNEGKGISEAVAQKVTHHITIPTFPEGATTVESLNVAVATAITLAEFRRRQRCR